MQILVAEDEFLVALDLQDVLEANGYRVTLAPNGEVALREWRRERHDLVVTDCRMPVMDGRELLERIREEDPAAPVVVVSGVADFLHDWNGPPDVPTLGKPIDHDRLLREVRTLLDRRGSPARG